MDVSIHGCWKRGATAIFDVIIVNLIAGSYLHQTSAKALVTAEKEEKDKYLQSCMECRHSLTLIVFSADIIPRTEVVVA